MLPYQEGLAICAEIVFTTAFLYLLAISAVQLGEGEKQQKIIHFFTAALEELIC